MCCVLCGVLLGPNEIKKIVDTRQSNTADAGMKEAWQNVLPCMLMCSQHNLYFVSACALVVALCSPDYSWTERNIFYTVRVRTLGQTRSRSGRQLACQQRLRAGQYTDVAKCTSVASFFNKVDQLIAI